MIMIIAVLLFMLFNNFYTSAGGCITKPRTTDNQPPTHW